MLQTPTDYDYILAKIHNSKPVSPLYKTLYTVSNSSLFALATLIFLFSIVWYEYDIFQTNAGCVGGCSLDVYIFEPLIEMGLLAIISSGFIYIFYRNTDWPFVKDRFLIASSTFLIGTLMTIILIGGANYTGVSVFNTFQELKNYTKTYIPWREKAVNTKKISLIIKTTKILNLKALEIIDPAKNLRVMV
jgi:hypothetical protein